MKEKREVFEDSEFYKNFKQINPFSILILIIFSLGFYIINWLYMRNKEFERLDDEAPSSKRGAAVILLTISWFIVSFYTNLFFLPYFTIFFVLDILVWSILLFLMIKYLHDFCRSYAKITKTTWQIWFFFLTISVSGLLLSLVFKMFFLVPFAMFFLITIPAMQADINKRYHMVDEKHVENDFYDV